MLISPPEKVFQVLCLSEFFQWVHTVICGVRMKVVWKSHGIYICFKNRLICFIFIYPFVVTKLYIRQKYSRFYCYCCFRANILYRCVGHDTISDNVVNLEHFFNFVFASINSHVSRQYIAFSFFCLKKIMMLYFAGFKNELIWVLSFCIAGYKTLSDKNVRQLVCCQFCLWFQ